MFRQQLSNSEGNLITERIKSVPIVHSTVNQVSEVYLRTRERNALFRLYFTAMEKSFNMATNIALTGAKPIYSKFDQQLIILNNIACTQLDNVEKKYPIIMKPTEEVLKVTMESCTAALSPVMHYVEAAQSYKNGAISSVKNFGCEAVNATSNRCQSVAKQLNDHLMENMVSKYALDRMGDTISYIDACADKYLPDEGEDKTVQLNKEDYIVRKMVHVSRKLTRRLARRCFKQGVRVKDSVGSTCQQVTHYTRNMATSSYAAVRTSTLNGLELAKTKGLSNLELVRQAASKTISKGIAPNMQFYLNSLDDYITNNFQAEILSQKELSKSPTGEDISGTVLKIFYLGNKAFFCITNRCGTTIARSAQYSTKFVTQPLEMARQYAVSGRQMADNFWREVNLNCEEAAKASVSTSSDKMTIYDKSVATARHLKMIGWIWFNKMSNPLFFLASFVRKTAHDKSEKSELSPKKEMELPISQQNSNVNASPGSNLRLNNIADASSTAAAAEPEKVPSRKQQKEIELEVSESTTDEDADGDDEDNVDDEICDNSYSDAYKCNAYSFEFNGDSYVKDPYFVPEERK